MVSYNTVVVGGPGRRRSSAASDQDQGAPGDTVVTRGVPGGSSSSGAGAAGSTLVVHDAGTVRAGGSSRSSWEPGGTVLASSAPVSSSSLQSSAPPSASTAAAAAGGAPRYDAWGDDLGVTSAGAGHRSGPLYQQQPQQQQKQGDDEDSYLAALKSAVQDREREQQQQLRRSGPTPRSGAQTGPPSANQPQQPSQQQPYQPQQYVPGMGLVHGPEAAVAAVQRLKGRLQTLFDGGQVVPVPFLSAALAAPMSLFNPLVCPGVTPLGNAGGVEGLDADAYAVLQGLCSSDGKPLLHPTHTNSNNSSKEGTSANGSGLLGLAPGATAGSSRQPGQPPPGLLSAPPPAAAVPSSVLCKALQHPGLQNLARSLGYHQACLEQLPLGPAGAAELQQVITDMRGALGVLLFA